MTRPVNLSISASIHAGSQEEVIKRIIDLIKQEGDIINDKVRVFSLILIQKFLCKELKHD